jgi:hypothetical protein
LRNSSVGEGNVLTQRVPSVFGSQFQRTLQNRFWPPHLLKLRSWTLHRAKQVLELTVTKNSTVETKSNPANLHGVKQMNLLKTPSPLYTSACLYRFNPIMLLSDSIA